MAKKIRNEQKAEVTPIAAQPAKQQQVNEPYKYTPGSFRLQAIVLAIIGFIFYFNTFSNEYAFDDMMAIVDNAYVQRGVSGIPDIMTHDAYQSYLEQRNGGNELSGGRYRPLSIVTFAIEQQLFGVTAEANSDNNNTAADRTPELEAKLISDMHARHIVNVLLYMLASVLLLYFLRKVVFPGNDWAPFFATLLFVIHPLHTEVVANVKSRDEILSVIFICLTFIKAFQYRETGRRKDLIWALVSYYLALLSKEYAATLLVLLPLSFYIFGKDEAKKSISNFLPYLIPLGLYLVLRLSSINPPGEDAEKDVMNNPYFLATVVQKYATIFLVLFYYLKLLVFPNPMVSDYSFNQIPYTTFSNPMVILSILLYLGIAVAGALYIKKRNVAGFAIAFFLINLALICNLFFNIGAPMGERLVFHSSIGLAIIAGMLINTIREKAGSTQLSATVTGALLVVLVATCGYTTISRNPDWKNNNTLFLTDVKKSPNSSLVNTNAGAACMMYAKKAAEGPERKKWFDSAIDFFTKTIEINPKHYFAYVNRGLCKFNMGERASAVSDWDTVRKYTPQQVNIARYLNIAAGFFFNAGNEFVARHQTDSAIFAFKYGVIAAPQSGEMWYNLGSAYFAAGKIHDARLAVGKAAQLLPQKADIRQFSAQLEQLDTTGRQR
jgi:tetratricopeptide (TPR) repeat protein